MLTKEDAQKLVEIEGKVRGAVFQTDAEYIKNKHGQDGLKKVKDELKRLGYPIEYEKIKAMEWRPLGLRAISLLVIKDLFKWEDKDVKLMGNSAPKYSFIIKLLMKFFISIEEAFSHAPEYWEKHYDVGKLEIVELNEEEKYAILYIKDFKIHQVYCKYLEGYFQRIFEFILPDEKVIVKENKCMFKGDDYHEFKGDWSN